MLYSIANSTMYIKFATEMIKFGCNLLQPSNKYIQVVWEIMRHNKIFFFLFFT